MDEKLKKSLRLLLLMVHEVGIFQPGKVLVVHIFYYYEQLLFSITKR